MSQDLTLTLESPVDASRRKVGTPAFGPAAAFNPNDVKGCQADAFNGDFSTTYGFTVYAICANVYLSPNGTSAVSLQSERFARCSVDH